MSTTTDTTLLLPLDLDSLVGSVRRGQLDEVKAMLTDTPTVDLQIEGLSLLYIATFKQHENVVEYLMSRGADIHLRNEDGKDSPLILARRRNDADLIRLLTTPRGKLVTMGRGSVKAMPMTEAELAARLESPPKLSLSSQMTSTTSQSSLMSSQSLMVPLSAATMGSSTSTFTSTSSSNANPCPGTTSGDQLRSSAQLMMKAVMDLECSICFCDDEKMVRLERCGHGCCESCMKEYLRNEVEGGASLDPVIECFARGCSESVSFHDVQLYASTSTTAKYQDRLCLAVLRLMKDFSWCTRCESGGLLPIPAQQQQAQAASSSSSSTSTSTPAPVPPPSSSSSSHDFNIYVSKCVDVHCDACKHAFCGVCREDAHPGLTCSQKHETVMLSDHYHTEKLSTKAIRSTCKACPNCEALTQRDGGCSHMICKSCSFAWCWLCGGPYKGRYTFNSKCPCGSD